MTTVTLEYRDGRKENVPISDYERIPLQIEVLPADWRFDVTEIDDNDFLYGLGIQPIFSMPPSPLRFQLCPDGVYRQI